MLKLIKFSTKTCGPCKMFGPVVTDICNELDVSLINVDCHDTEAEYNYIEMNVKSVPTVIIMVDEVEMERVVSAIPKQAMINIINKYK